MTRQLDGGDQMRQALSDLADGRATPAEAQSLTSAWKDDPALRRDWLALHLIGDSLRSAELSQQAQRSEDLLAGLRERLAREPVPLRPRRRLEWLAPLGVAAGFVIVALAAPALQSILPHPSATQLAQQDEGAWGAVPSTGSTLTSAQPSFVQSVAEPQRARALLPAGAASLREVVLDGGVAPFDMAGPAAKPAASAATVAASSAR